MIRRIIILIIVIAATGLSALETGKIIDKPELNVSGNNAEDGVLISDKRIIPGFDIVKHDFNVSEPVFSLAQVNNNLYAGTGSKPCIINTETGDTLAEFSDGETVYLAESYKKRIIAAIAPSGLLIAADSKGIDTLKNFENMSINAMHQMDSKLYIAVGNRVFVYDGDEVRQLTALSDKNVTFIASDSDDNLLLGTEGNGRLLRGYERKEMLLSMKNSEIDFIHTYKNSIYVLVNQLQKDTDRFKSFFLKLDDHSVDTIIADNNYIISAAAGSKGIFLSRAETPEILYYDYSDVFSCGTLSSDYILSARRIGKHVYLTTGQPGNIYIVRDRVSKTEFDSRIISFNQPVYVNSMHPDYQGNIKFYMRTGNSPLPDSAWTDFLLVKPGSTEHLPAGQYMQYKALFAEGNASLNTMEFYYRTDNREPVIDSVKVFRPRLLPEYALSEGIFAMPVENTGLYPEYNVSIMKTNSKIIYIEWYSNDPDQDRLTSDIYLSDRRGKYLISENLETDYALLYTDMFEEGSYNIELYTDDSLSNPENPLTGHYRTELMIDNTPPRIYDVSYKMNTLTFKAEDALSFIDEAYYSVNGSQYEKAEPDDRIFDSRNESFTVRIPRGENSLLIMIYAVDIYGNIARYRKTVR
ncbi:MAG: hypothetical protein R6U31_01990 [bacterium]